MIGIVTAIGYLISMAGCSIVLTKVRNPKYVWLGYLSYFLIYAIGILVGRYC